jgi:ATP-dependent helicase/nuclease subunit A
MNQLQIYKASAGSGKTYTLTRNYLVYAFASPENYAKVLAVTFTNKAASEMKERILEELNKLIDSPLESSYFEDLMQLCGLRSFAQLSEKALDVRTRILHNYSRFSVGTIDSFVQRVVRAFSYEIGIQTGYKIEMDTPKVINELIDLLIKSLSQNPFLFQWIIGFVHDKLEGGKKFNAKRELSGLVGELFKESYQNLAYKHPQHTDVDKTMAFLQELKNNRKTFEKQLETFASEAARIIKSYPLDGFKVPQVYDLICKFITQKITSKSVDALFPGVKVEKAVDNISGWYAKNTEKEIIRIIESAYPQLNSVLNAVNSFVNQNVATYIVSNNLLANFYAFAILSDVAALLPAYREENDLLLISDTTSLLKDLITENEAPFIYEKVGNRFQHILIDEFQDTSGFQWENFKPLIRNSLSEGNECMIVGDVKQSIYRWRGGDWNLLLNQVREDIGDRMISNRSLDVNFRSRRNVILFNNTVFGLAPEDLQKSFNEELDEVIDLETKASLRQKAYEDILVRAYKGSEQQVPADERKLGGRVEVKFYPPAEGSRSKKSWRESVYEDLPQTIHALIAEEGYRPGDLAILVRKNKEAQEIVELLMDYQHQNPESAAYEILSADALLLANCPAVRLLVAALRYIHNPQDKINLTYLLYEYNRIQHHTTRDEEIFHAHNSDAESLSEFLPEGFLADQVSLKSLPLFQLTEQLINTFSIGQADGQMAYLRAYLDEVYNYQKNNSADLHSFLEWWGENEAKLSLKMPDGLNAVTVMTIHKSKGLAFNVVLVPYCDWGLNHDMVSSPLLWVETNTPPFDTFSFLPVKYQKNLIKTQFAPHYFEEKLFYMMDALNALYVTFTRARQELRVFAPLPKKASRENIGFMLYDLITNHHGGDCFGPELQIGLSPYFNPETNTFQLTEGHTVQQAKPSGDKEDYRLDSFPFHTWQGRLEIHKRSDDFFIQSIQAVKDKVYYGAFMHEVLSSIRTGEDIEPVLGEMLFEGRLTQQEKDELQARVYQIIENPLVANWFSPEWTIYTEKAILTSSGQLRIPDRVLASDTEVIIIDFKFGEMRDEYHQQVQEYMKIVSEIEEKPARGFLYFPDKEEVIEISLTTSNKAV